MPWSRGRKQGTGSTSGALGRKAPNLRVWWGPTVVKRADGTIIEVKPPLPEPPMSPLKGGRRRPKGRRK